MLSATPSVPVVSAEDLEKKLLLGPTRFGFVKKAKDAIRFALGTTSLTSIPKDKHPKKLGSSSEKTVTFFDLEKQAWRCVSKESIVFGNF